MTTNKLTITVEVSRSREFQSVRAGATVEVSLEPGESPQDAYRRVYRSMSRVCRDEAQAGLERVLFGEGAEI